MFTTVKLFWTDMLKMLFLAELSLGFEVNIG